ncbi:MAG: hypothetical protein E6K87_03455 [Thaumarchaeota archaeon]|nr:MAG: hypothetical protein E6K87_03455 [Nitrososphaerota archaeon]
MIKDKLSRNLKLNTHEALLVFCAYIVSEIRSGKSESQIIDNSSKILTRDNVLCYLCSTVFENIEELRRHQEIEHKDFIEFHKNKDDHAPAPGDVTIF